MAQLNPVGHSAEQGRGTVAQPAVQMLRRPSTVDLIVHELRHAIYRGRLRPGEPVREADVAAQLGVSRGPLREAAQRLVQDGLLWSKPGAGLRVVTIRPQEIGGLFQARWAIEGSAVRLLCDLPAEARGERTACLHRQLRSLVEAVDDGTDARRIGDADLDVHHGLVEATENAWLIRFSSSLSVQTRIASLSHPDGYVVRTDVVDAAEKLVTLIDQGDGMAAQDVLAAHFDETVRRLSGHWAGPFDLLEGEADDVGFSFRPLP